MNAQRDEDRDELTRWALRQAAILITLALLTGFGVAAAMTGKVHAEPRAMLASHLNALLGAFWVLGVGLSMPWVRWGPRGRRTLARTVVGAQYANWLVTGLKSFLGVAGLEWTSNAHNNAIFGALTLGVVLPSLGASIAWIVALARGGDERSL